MYAYIASSWTGNNERMWGFGMVDTSQTPALGCMHIVPDHIAATLLSVIRNHTAQHTTIHSDQWAVYSGSVGTIPTIIHKVINNSLHFADPNTGVHTQNVESYWNRVKIKLRRMRGCHAHHLASYLDNFRPYKVTYLILIPVRPDFCSPSPDILLVIDG